MTSLNNFLNSIFDDAWSSTLFFAIPFIIINRIMNAISQKRRDTLIKKDYERMGTNRREYR